MLLLALFLGYLYVWSRSLWLPVLVHFINNSMAVIAIYYSNKGVISDRIETLGTESGDWLYVFLSIGIAGYFVYRIFHIQRALISLETNESDSKISSINNSQTP